MAPVQYMKETSNNSKKGVLCCLQDQSTLGAMSEVDSPEQDSIWARFFGSSMHPIALCHFVVSGGAFKRPDHIDSYLLRFFGTGSLLEEL